MWRGAWGEPGYQVVRFKIQDVIVEKESKYDNIFQ